LVDNGSTDNTAVLLERFARTAHVPVRVVHEPRKGVANAQNAGLKWVHGEIIALTDDDCYPAEDFLVRILECFAEGGIDYLGGRVLLHDPADYPITIQLLKQRVELRPRGYVPPGLIHGAAYAFKRIVLETIGGFDPLLGPGSPCNSGNDIDVLSRASAAGFRGAYDPRPLVYHHHGRRTAQEVKDLRDRYDISRGIFFYKGLADPRTRSAFVWPVIRHLAGHILKMRGGTMMREFRGARLYVSLC
jgi:glycosyltransferase involved in cell wall biosynthesis